MFDIVEHAIDAAGLRQDLVDDAAGGLVIFEGLVRDHNEGRAVSALEYEIFTGMAEKEAAKIFAEAREQFDVIHLRGAHRFGMMGIGEMAIWVGASARHRAAAFQACRFLIDEIKHRLPVWKKEHYVSGPAEWVDCLGCAHHHQPQFTEQQYYGRQTALPDFGTTAQDKLRSARVLVVGAGGLGCPALSTLAGAGIGRITICDGDRLDVSNLHRQTLYGHEDVGQDKAQLAARKLTELNPFLDIKSETARFTTANAGALLAEHDVILDCTDNFSTKFLLHDACYLAEKVLVQASIYQYEGQLQVFDFRQTSAAGCQRCAWPEMPAAGCVGSCTEAGVLGPVPAILGNMQALETIKILTGMSSPATSATLLVDLLSLSTSTIRRPRISSCPLCGEDPQITDLSQLTAAPPEAWEIGLADFRTAYSDGRVIDIRSADERTILSAEEKSWEHLPNPDQQELAALSGQESILLVCQIGVRTHHLVADAKADGEQRFWSLWRGVNGLQSP